MQTRGGYTPDEIRAMPMPDVTRIHAYWGRVPPLRDMVAGFLGVRDRSAGQTAPAALEDLPEFEE